MTDAEWDVLEPQTRAVMAELRRGPGGRPMAHRLRVVVDAIRYLVRYGVEWRALPPDFPPWQAVYAFFERWAQRGLPERLVDRLRGQLRLGVGRAELPTAAVIDSQSVKAAGTVGAATSGYDGGKKIKGRKRHVAVDGTGWLPAVLVTAAGVQDRDAGHRLVALLRERFSTITLVWAEGGYAGRLVTWAATVPALTVTIVKRCEDRGGFVVLARRWVVEPTLGWLSRYRRLVGDHERLTAHHEAMVLWATATIMTRQLVQQRSWSSSAAGNHAVRVGALNAPCLGRSRKIHKRHETVRQQALKKVIMPAGAGAGDRMRIGVVARSRRRRVLVP